MGLQTIESKNDKGKREISEEEIMEMISYEQFPDMDESEDETNLDHGDEDEIYDKDNEPSSLLRNILNLLIKGKNGRKWIKFTTTDLYVNKLKSAESITKNFYSYEMDDIAKAVANQSNCKLLFSKSCNKTTNVNILSKYFQDKTVWYPKSSKVNHKEGKSLCKLAKNIILASYYQKLFWLLVWVE